MNLNNYTIYGKFHIYGVCHQSLPCQHYVVNTETGEKSLLNSLTILKLLDEEKIKAPLHFERYRTRLNT